jgi:polyisoprenoid-binding protein YceI
VNKVTASAGITRGKESITISAFKVDMSVYSIKSTEGSTMDNNTYKALKASQYPDIIYELIATSTPVVGNAGVYLLKARGHITIAGVTKEVEMNVKIHEEGGQLVFEGSQKIRMTDYNIKPPVAMLGMLKTGDEITISYNMVF